jgi:hypothetical protein
MFSSHIRYSHSGDLALSMLIEDKYIYSLVLFNLQNVVFR